MIHFKFNRIFRFFMYAYLLYYHFNYYEIQLPFVNIKRIIQYLLRSESTLGMNTLQIIE
ncbi:hypothetical protein pb186bvf_020993 [Paramecium bursaria]